MAETALNSAIVEDVANTNLKVIGGFPAVTAVRTANMLAEMQVRIATLAADEAQNHQKNMNAIQQMFIGNLAKTMSQLDPMEAASATKILESGLADKLASLSAAVAQMMGLMQTVISANQQSSKTAGNTPPVTP